MLASRFVPTGIALASIEGAADASERSVAIDALVAALHAHPATSAAYRVGAWSQLTVRTHAEAFCDAHAGIGALYVARLAVAGAGASAGERYDATVTLTSFDCRGALDRRATASAHGATPAAAIRSAAGRAVRRSRTSAV